MCIFTKNAIFTIIPKTSVPPMLSLLKEDSKSAQVALNQFILAYTTEMNWTTTVTNRSFQGKIKILTVTSRSGRNCPLVSLKYVF